jgi:hypothetical protein
MRRIGVIFTARNAENIGVYLSRLQNIEKTLGWVLNQPYSGLQYFLCQRILNTNLFEVKWKDFDILRMC